MGIQGLWSVLEPVAEPVTLESLEGKRLALDISIWLHQAAHGYTDYQLSTKSPHLSLLLRRLSKLLFYKIRPFFVFDGPNVPIFKKKLLRDRQVKSYVEDLTITKVQKRALQRLTSSQLGGDEHCVDELRTVFVSQAKRRDDDGDNDDLFDVSEPSTSKDRRKERDSEDEPEVIYSSFESSRSSEFDRAEFESLATRDEQVDYLLAARDKVRSGLKLKEVSEDSKTFSNLQINRLLKRNRINEQLELVKSEALNQKVFPTTLKRSTSDNSIRMAAMESMHRVHVVKDDNEVHVMNDKGAKTDRTMDSVAWPTFVEKIKEEEEVKNAEEVDSSEDRKMVTVSDEDDDDDALQEVIYASLLEDVARKTDKPRVPMGSYGSESKGDMIERLRTAFAERTRDLQHDTWSPPSSETSEEFVEVPELLNDFFAKANVPSPSWKVSDECSPKKCFSVEKKLVDESMKNDDVKVGEEEGEMQGPSMRPVRKIDVFASAREEGIYKDCQDLLRICGIPFVVAPGEAEAQCCELERLGLVNGIISDDSDVWLFGAAVVYKNMFNQKRRLQMFAGEAIQNRLGLSRWEAIQIALLSGGDYTNGLEGVGVVSALELISEFATASRQVDAGPQQEAFENLQRIATWLNHRDVATECNDLPSSSSGYTSEQQNGKAFPGKFMENARRLKLRRLVEKHNAIETLYTFPSREVFNAYAQPQVDSSTEKPKWRKINMEELESFVWEKLGWDVKHLRKQTNKSLLRWNEYLNPAAGGSGKSYQMHITSFAHNLHKSEEDQRLTPALRVRNALQRLVTIKSSRNQTSSESTGNIPITEEVKNVTPKEEPKKRPSKKSVAKKIARKRKGPANASKNRKRKLTGKDTSTVVRKELQLSEESSNSDAD